MKPRKRTHLKNFGYKRTIFGWYNGYARISYGMVRRFSEVALICLLNTLERDRRFIEGVFYESKDS